MRERLLFVTKGGDNFEEGFSYVVELAKTLKAGVSVLMVYNKRTMDAYEDLMSAAVFAEAGEFKTAKEILHDQENELKAEADKKLKDLSEKYKEISNDINYQIYIGDVLSSIKEFLKNKPNIDMILLSPSLSKSKKEIDLKKLIKKISKPIVTISQPLQAGA
ncbi:MAG: hypothetical protein HZA14_07925 [Nitrospirae bacterium]|nr:hypothetical protein [Nitrospirota bacterium]